MFCYVEAQNQREYWGFGEQAAMTPGGGESQKMCSMVPATPAMLSRTMPIQISP